MPGTAHRVADPRRVRRRPGHLLELRRRGAGRRRRRASPGSCARCRGSRCPARCVPRAGRGHRRVPAARGAGHRQRRPPDRPVDHRRTGPAGPATPGDRLHLVLCARADPAAAAATGTGWPARCRRSAPRSWPSRRTRPASCSPRLGVAGDARGRRGALRADARAGRSGCGSPSAPLKQGVPPEQLVASLAHDDGSVAQYLFAEVLEDQPAAVRRFLLRISVTAELWPDLVDRLCGRRNGRRILAGLAHANAFVEQSPGRARRLPHPPAVPGDAAGAARLRPPRRARRPAPDVRRLVRRGGRAMDGGQPRRRRRRTGRFVTRLLVDELLVARLLAHGTDPALRGAARPSPRACADPEAAVSGGRRRWPDGRRRRLRPTSPRRRRGAGRGRRAGAARLGRRSPADGGRGRTCEPPTLLAACRRAAALVAAAARGAGGAARAARPCSRDLRAASPWPRTGPDRHLLAGLRAAAAGGERGRRPAGCVPAPLGLPRPPGGARGHLHPCRAARREAEACAAEERGGRGGTRPGRGAGAAPGCTCGRYALVEAREWLAGPGSGSGAAGARCVGGRWHAVLQGQQLRLRHEYARRSRCCGPILQATAPAAVDPEQVVTEVVRLAVARGRRRRGAGPARTGADDGTGGGAAAGDGRPARPERRGPDLPAERRVRGRVPVVAVRAASSGRASYWRPARTGCSRGTRRGAGPRAPGAAALAVRRHPAPGPPAAAHAPRLQEARRRGSTRPAGLGPVPAGTGPGGDRGTARWSRTSATARLEVLRYLAEMLSTAEIAATMFISVNTVRTHIRSILRKLAATRRNQAVRRARERGLL